MKWPFIIAIILLFSSCSDPNGTTPDADTIISGIEECNNIDDDSDGTIDEDVGGGPLRRDCTNPCGAGVEECEGGEWRYCTAPTPLAETCNGLDDDCDGQTDEDCECRHGDRRECGISIGVCEPGVEHCEGGVWGECQLAYDPEALVEECNDGLDNDCDGDTDEECTCVPGAVQTCGVDEGECQAGEMLCLDDSTWSDECVGAVGEADEICDGLDNDCDGSPDSVVSTGFSWSSDEQEPNNVCTDAAPMYNESGVAQLEQDGDWVSVAVDNTTEIMDYPSIYAPGDEDWYYTRAIESSGFCIGSECTFVVQARLDLKELGWLDGTLQNHEDYRLCIVVGDCSQATEPANVTCTHASDWSDTESAYTLNVMWGGACVTSDDSKDIKIQVHSPSGMACGYYQLSVRFYYDSTIPCPGG